MTVSTAQFQHLQGRIARGEYEVCSTAVADAMLRRIGGLFLDRDLNGTGQGKRAVKVSANGAERPPCPARNQAHPPDPEPGAPLKS